MKIHRAYKTELNLNNCQRSLMVECAGVARWAWNWGLERRIREYKEEGKTNNYFRQNKELNQIKKTEYQWLRNYPQTITQMALRDLDLSL